jgi:Fe-S-cluster containining protein
LWGLRSILQGGRGSLALGARWRLNTRPPAGRLAVAARAINNADEMLADEVAAAAARPEVRAAMTLLYADLQREIDARRPLCTASGRCCHFDAFGHRLYVTTMELAAFSHALQETVPASDRPVAPRGPHPRARVVHLAGSDPGASCIFQRDGLCSVHPIRPFGCRIFFCDATSTQWQHERYAHFHAHLQRLHAQLDVPYRYIEWRAALAELNLKPVSNSFSHASVGPKPL